jgi:hypothetical protein
MALAKPDQVGRYVMSAVQSRFGASAANARRTRSGAGAAAASRRVVRAARRRWQPATPAARISRATRLRPQRTPCSLTSSACTRGAPYVPRLRRWMARIVSVSAASATARADGERARQA